MKTKIASLAALLAVSLSSGVSAVEADRNVRCIVEGTSANGQPILTDVTSQTIPHSFSTLTTPFSSGFFTFSSNGFVDGSNDVSPPIVVGNRTGDLLFSDPNFPQVPEGVRFFIQTENSPAFYAAANNRQVRRNRPFLKRNRNFFIPYAQIRDSGFSTRMRLPEIVNGRVVRTRVSVNCNLVD